MSDKVIVVAGGVGPQAGLQIHQHILANTCTDGTDQAHLDVFHFCRPHAIPDRTAALLEQREMEPVLGMLETFRIAEAAIAASGKQAVGAVLCNTFHAPPIMRQFLSGMHGRDSLIRILDMVDETVEHVLRDFQGSRAVGLLSTNGMRYSGHYASRLLSEGVEVLQLPDEFQQQLHEAICSPTWGIKAQTDIHPKARTHLQHCVRWLSDAGADAVVMACTEIPLAIQEPAPCGVALVDPMVILARALIREAAPAKLKPLPIQAAGINTRGLKAG